MPLQSHDETLRVASELSLTEMIKELRSIAKDRNSLFEFERDVLSRAADMLETDRRTHETR